MPGPRRKLSRRSFSLNWQQQHNIRTNQTNNLSLIHSVLRAAKIQTRTLRVKSRPRASSRCLRIITPVQWRSRHQSPRTEKRPIQQFWATGRPVFREIVRIKITSSSVLSTSCCRSIRSSKESTGHRSIKSASLLMAPLSQLHQLYKETVIRWAKSESCRLYRSVMPPTQTVRRVRCRAMSKVFRKYPAPQPRTMSTK